MTTKPTTNKEPTNPPPPFQPKPSWTLISQGAEARIWKIPNYFPNNRFAICKERFVKAYRHATLDAKLNKQRCKSEGKCMLKGRKGGVATPTLYGVQPPCIYMEYVNGVTVRQWLEEQAQGGTATGRTTITYKTLAESIGRIVATLHNTGTIHGDLTTSNMMLEDTHHTLQLIDFGLARVSSNPEELAVDLYVLERAIISTHPEVENFGFTDDILKEYKAVSKKSDAVLQRLSQVRLRGRKRECFG